MREIIYLMNFLKLLIGILNYVELYLKTIVLIK